MTLALRPCTGSGYVYGSLSLGPSPGLGFGLGSWTWTYLGIGLEMGTGHGMGMGAAEGFLPEALLIKIPSALAALSFPSFTPVH